jgi:hypothetical protein
MIQTSQYFCEQKNNSPLGNPFFCTKWRHKKEKKLSICSQTNFLWVVFQTQVSAKLHSLLASVSKTSNELL